MRREEKGKERRVEGKGVDKWEVESERRGTNRERERSAVSICLNVVCNDCRAGVQLV